MVLRKIDSTSFALTTPLDIYGYLAPSYVIYSYISHNLRALLMELETLRNGLVQLLSNAYYAISIVIVSKLAPNDMEMNIL